MMDKAGFELMSGYRNGNGNGHNHNGNGHNGNGNGKRQYVEVALMEDTLRDPELLARYELDFPAVDRDAIQGAVRTILTAVGENPDRDGLKDTPKRVAKAYDEILEGYTVDPAKLVNGAIFDVEYDDMVIVHNIEYFSLCEHHMLPFMGHAHVAYIPNEKVIGLSKIPRIVDMFSRRLQVQERLTRQIADFLTEVLDARGVAVVMDGQHMCSMMRGVEKCHSGMTTSAFTGAFKQEKGMRDEFMAHLQRAAGGKSNL
jgi:GTP cyclohydrolase I